MKTARPQKAMQERSISPALESWIKNCIVPILVQEYIALQNPVVTDDHEVLQRESRSATAARVGQ